MKKDISSLLQRGNITPKQRVLLLVADSVSEERTGKGILTEAEKHALSEGWQPDNNDQVHEYNRYNRGWKLIGCAELDTQTTFMNAQIVYFQEKQLTNFLLFYPFFRDTKRWVERLDDIKPVNINRAFEIVKKQKEVKLKNGLDFDYAVYQLAFESLDKQLQDDLKTLYEEVECEHQYLDQEEAIANLFNGKDELPAENKIKLAELIVKSGYNEFAKEWQLWHYFTSIPLKELGKKWMDKRGVKPEKPEDEQANKALVSVAKKLNLGAEEGLREYTAENIAETIEVYAKGHNTTVEAELKDICLEWLDKGLLNEYEPLFKSISVKAYNGDTKLPHNEIFRAWIKVKAKARETLTRLIAERKLNKEGDVITGDSLYKFKSDYQFIKKHNQYVDEYDANLGIVYEDNDPNHAGVHLDREFLITNLDEDGKPGFNFSQIAMANIKGYFETAGLVEETEMNGERVIEFESEDFNKLIRNTTEGLKKHYSTLLTFRKLFEKLSEIYEVDLTYRINEWIKETEGFIDSHNSTLKLATKQSFEEMRTKKMVRFKDDLFIDRTKIEPTQDKIFEFDYFKELADLEKQD